MLVIGHRGAPKVCVENTLDSFVEAIAQGADGFELDVRLGPEDELVIWHDPSLRADQEQEFFLHELTARSRDEIDLRLVARRPDLARPIRVCTLREVIAQSSGAIIDIELKNLPGEAAVDWNHRLPRLVADLVTECGKESQVVVTSFWSAALDVLHREAPEIRTGWLLVPGVPLERVIEEAHEKGHSIVLPFDTSIGINEPMEQIDKAHQCNLDIWVWTVNDPSRMRALFEAGIDGIITDFPGRCARIRDELL